MDYIDPFMEVRVYQLPDTSPAVGGLWVYEQKRYGREPYRIAFATESEARYFAKQQELETCNTPEPKPVSLWKRLVEE